MFATALDKVTDSAHSVSSWPFGGYSARNRQIGQSCKFLLVTPMAFAMGLWMGLLVTHLTNQLHSSMSAE